MAKKLLGLRLCEHDSNISYFDGSKVFILNQKDFIIKNIMPMIICGNGKMILKNI